MSDVKLAGAAKLNVEVVDDCLVFIIAFNDPAEAPRMKDIFIAELVEKGTVTLRVGSAKPA